MTSLHRSNQLPETVAVYLRYVITSLATSPNSSCNSQSPHARREELGILGTTFLRGTRPDQPSANLVRTRRSQPQPQGLLVTSRVSRQSILQSSSTFYDIHSLDWGFRSFFFIVASPQQGFLPGWFAHQRNERLPPQPSHLLPILSSWLLLCLALYLRSGSQQVMTSQFSRTNTTRKRRKSTPRPLVTRHPTPTRTMTLLRAPHSAT